MMQIIVRICPGGDRKRAYEQAVAEVSNLSDLDEFSDYAVWASENRNGVTGAPAWSAKGMIGLHDRHSSIWKLVERISKFAGDEADKAAAQR